MYTRISLAHQKKKFKYERLKKRIKKIAGNDKESQINILHHEFKEWRALFD
jgi:hypothetical protein